VGAGDAELPTNPTWTKVGDSEDDKVPVRNDNRPIGLRGAEEPADVRRGEGGLVGSDRESIDGRLGSGGQDEHLRCPVSQIAISPAEYAPNCH
jgi:hypothetical protein